VGTKIFAVTQDVGVLDPYYGNGAGTMMWAAYSDTYTNGSRMVLQFGLDWTDVSSITSAVLNIKSGDLFGYTNPHVLIKRATSPWNEGVWAGGRDTAGPQPGAIVYPGPSTTDTNAVDWHPGTSHDTWVSVDITNIVRDWAPAVGVSGGQGNPNYGIMILRNNETTTEDNWDAYTRESGDGAYITLTYESGFIPTPPTTETKPRSLDTQFLLMKGSTDAYITECDAWYSTMDPFSWGSSYSWTETPGSTANIKVRGQSFRWYATVPEGKGGGQARIDVYNNVNTQHLSKIIDIPEGLSADVLFEIPYESGIMKAGTTYDITITSLSGFVSIDSLEGFWGGSLVDYNEDSRRIVFSSTDTLVQVYDGRYSYGSIYKWNDINTYATFDFRGDRVMVLSALGPNFGKMRIQLLRDNGQYNSNPDVVLLDGLATLITIDLDNGKRGGEVSKYIAFDSRDHATLEWGSYRLVISIDPSNGDYGATLDDLNKSSFPDRCHNCSGDTSATTTIAKYVYLDSILCQEEIALSANFQNQNHFDILTSMTEAVQVESSVTEEGVNFLPRVGRDTDIILREGQNTVVGWSIVNDLSGMATILYSNGGDIDGMPQFTITQDKKNKVILGRDVVRQQDFKDISSYLQLIGMSRTELKHRRLPDKRVSVSHVAKDLDLEAGDSFTLYSKKMGPVRLRINNISIKESASAGRVYDLSCVRWTASPVPAMIEEF
jgi:hypothetical protein